MGYIRDFRGFGAGTLTPGMAPGSVSVRVSAPPAYVAPTSVVQMVSALPIGTLAQVTGILPITTVAKSKDVTLNLPPVLPGVPLKTGSSGGGGDSSSDTPPATLPSGSSGNYTKAPPTTDALTPTTTPDALTPTTTPATSSGSTAKTALIAGGAAIAALLLAKLL